MFKLIRKLLKSWKLTLRIYYWLKNEDTVELSKKAFNHISTITMDTGDIYRPGKDLGAVLDVQSYYFDDIGKDDIVIDIGANIGAFSIPASRLSRRVYAVEPLTVDELQGNIALNQRDITVLEAALGNGQTVDIEWQDSHRRMETLTLQAIKTFCGGCDFLKIDCEGYEWVITPEELSGIRRIEMEVHKVRGLSPSHNTLGRMEGLLEEAGFKCIVDKGEFGFGIIHAWRNGSTPLVPELLDRK